jgi:Uma2 family endonuclease
MSYARLETYAPQRVPIPGLKTDVMNKLKPDRPAWIPSHVTENWDTDPFAYQTEEELMPTGGVHGQLLTAITMMLHHHLQKQGLMLLVDTFLLYRDSKEVKNRIGPDLLLMEACFPAPSSYDLDTRPPPRCLIELTSPKSHFKDLQNNVSLYFDLGVETYLVIDAITPKKQLRSPIELHLWRKTTGQGYQKMTADHRGYFLLPEMNLKMTVENQRFIFVDTVTNEVLRDTGQLTEALKEAEQRAEGAFDKGEEKGRLAEKQDTARKMLADGLQPEMIMKYTGLSEKELASIQS